MVKFVLMIPRRGDVTRAQFLDQWRNVCVPSVTKLKGLRRYVINPTVATPGGEAPKYEAIGELWFDSVEAGKAALESPEGKKVQEDMATFADMKNVVISITEEEEISLAPQP